MAAPKFIDRANKQKAMSTAVVMWSEGYTQIEIAQRLGISQPVVSDMLAKARKLGSFDLSVDRQELLQGVLRQYWQNLREAEAAWQASKSRTEEEESETTIPIKGKNGKAGIKTVKKKTKKTVKNKLPYS